MFVLRGRWEWVRRASVRLLVAHGAAAMVCSVACSSSDDGGKGGGGGQGGGGATSAGGGSAGMAGGAGGTAPLDCVGNEMVCGLSCCGVGTCDAFGGYTMKLEPEAGKCKLTITDPSFGNALAVMACDGSLAAVNPDGTPNDQPGTWTGGGTTFTMSIDGFDHHCSVSPK